jgi:hypothetical protein
MMLRGNSSMAKRTPIHTTGSPPLTAEAVLGIVNSLPAATRAQVFGLLARHPDNDLVKTLTRLLRMAEQLLDLREKVRRLDQLKRGVEYHKTLARCLREGADLAEQLLASLEEHGELVRRYRKGPEARAQHAHDRREKIRQLLGAGLDSPRKILQELRQLGFNVKLKTVQNDISIIRGG